MSPALTRVCYCTGTVTVEDAIRRERSVTCAAIADSDGAGNVCGGTGCRGGVVRDVGGNQSAECWGCRCTSCRPSPNGVGWFLLRDLLRAFQMW